MSALNLPAPIKKSLSKPLRFEGSQTAGVSQKACPDLSLGAAVGTPLLCGSLWGNLFFCFVFFLTCHYCQLSLSSNLVTFLPRWVPCLTSMPQPPRIRSALKKASPLFLKLYQILPLFPRASPPLWSPLHGPGPPDTCILDSLPLPQPAQSSPFSNDPSSSVKTVP